MEDVLERGAARFFARPRVMLATARTVREVQRFFVVLRPEHGGLYRRVVIGRKRMPDPGRRDKEWATVDRIGTSLSDVLEDVGPSSYDTKTEGFRVQSGASEIAHGTYAIRTHDDHAHLDYELDDAPLIDDVGLAERGSLIAAVFNPEAPRRTRAPVEQLELDLDDEDGGESGPREPTIYPDELQAKFEDKRFAPLEPAFLDHVGCEIVLIGQEKVA